MEKTLRVNSDVLLVLVADLKAEGTEILSTCQLAGVRYTGATVTLLPIGLLYTIITAPEGCQCMEQIR